MKVSRSVWLFSLLLVTLLVAVACATPVAPAPAPAATQAPAQATSAPQATAAPAEPTAAAAPTQAASGGGDGTFVMTNLADPAPLDPAKTFATFGYTFERNVYSPLVDYKLGTAELEPALATSWEPNADYTEWTFNLRDGVKFHNGDTLDADDVVTTFERVAKINQNQPGTVVSGTVESVTKKDDKTVVFKLTKPYVLFPAVLPKVGIVSANDVKKNEKDGDMAQDWFLKNANGTGPYKLAEFVPGEQYTLERFDDWWNKAAFPANSYKRIIVRPIGDSAVQRQLIEKGDSCLGSWMAYLDMVEASKTNNAKLVSGNSYMTLVLQVSSAKPPMDNPKVRQAMVYAFPYEKFQEFYQGYSEIPTSVLSKNYPGSDSALQPLKQDLDKAKELLKEAGHPDGGFTVTYTAVEGLEDQRQAALLYQDALKQIGVTLEIKTLPFGTYFEQGQKAETAATFNPHYEAPETADPFQWFKKMWGSKGLLNWTYQDTTAMDKTIEAGQAEPDEAKRTDLIHQAQQLVSDNVYAIPISNFVAINAICKEAEGFVYQPTDLLYVPRFWPLHR